MHIFQYGRDSMNSYRKLTPLYNYPTWLSHVVSESFTLFPLLDSSCDLGTTDSKFITFILVKQKILLSFKTIIVGGVKQRHTPMLL